MEPTKTSVKLNDIIKQTISELLVLEGVSQSESLRVDVTSKFGLDGSGSHQIRHQKAEKEDDADGLSYIGAFWCPLAIKVFTYFPGMEKISNCQDYHIDNIEKIPNVK